MTMVVESSRPGQHDPQRSLTLRQRGLLQVLEVLAAEGPYDDRTVWQPIAAIAERAGASRTTVLRILRELEAAGAILRNRDTHQPQAPTLITLPGLST